MTFQVLWDVMRVIDRVVPSASKTILSSKTSGNMHSVTQRYMPEYFQQHLCASLA
jgi:hypothetical protein